MRKSYLLSLFILLLCLSALAQSDRDALKSRTDSLANSASVAFINYDFTRSIENCLELIEIASAEEDFYNLTHAYNLLGVTYETLEDSIRAKENYLKALEYAQSSENDTILWYAYNNLGNIYSANKGTISKGLNFYKKAIEVSSKISDSSQVVIPLMNIAWTYLENNKLNKAFPYLERAHNLFEKRNEEDLLTESNINVLYGMYHSGKENYELANTYFNTGIAIAEKDTLIAEASFAYDEFSKMLFKSGNFSEAYEALNMHHELREKIINRDKELQRNAVYERFQTEEYRKDLQAAKREQLYKDEVLEKTQQLSAIMVIFLVGMFFFIVMLFRNNKIRQKLISQLKGKNEELREAKDEAERLSSLKTRFFSTVSHELRTPLYGVVGLASLLLEENMDKQKEADLKSLKFSADYLLALINDVLQMNKMESQLIHLENSTFNINSLFQGIVKTFENTRNTKNLKIELKIDPSIPYLIGDPMRLSQVMMNLVGNAVKFTEKGKIWIQAKNVFCNDENCRIYFEVGDTGIGIPRNQQEEIFEEFSQLKVQNLNYQGTGLGLPIVKKLLDLFNSKIHLESIEGQGSIFSFEIKFQIGREVENVKSPEAEGQEEMEKLTRRILVVDDNRINQVVTRRILEKRDFKCLVAQSGEEALEIIRATHLDVVLMDVNMPGMNGMETTRKIREFNENIPVIALTAVEVGEMKEEILAAGMNDIINKPYDIAQFFNTIFRNLLQPVA